MIVFFLLGAGCSEVSKTSKSGKPATVPIKIGWLGPLTGDAASLGQDALVAAKLAVEEVNTAGGVNGRQLELIAEDGRCESKDAASGMNKLLTNTDMSVVIGGMCSSETSAVAPIAEQNKKILFSGCSSAPSISKAGDYIFRSYPSDALQGKFVAEYMYRDLGKRKVAILAVSNEWGEGIRKTFSERFGELGGVIVFDEQYAQESRDLKAELSKIKQTDAEALYFLGVTEASLVGLRQARELGIAIPIIGGDTWDDSKIVESPQAQGVIYTGADLVAPTDWESKLKSRGGNTTLCTPGNYNNIHIIADIIKRVGTDTTKIKDELYKVKNYPGVNGPVTLDKNGDLTDSKFVVKKIEDKKVQVVE